MAAPFRWLLALLPMAAIAADSQTHYAGILPCADCPALRVDLALSRDAKGAPGTYQERLTYVDRRGRDVSFTETGRWSIERGSAADAQATIYRLTESSSGGRQLLKVEGERALRIVDAEGREIASPIPQVLWKRTPADKPIAIGKADANRTIALNAGQEVAVTLPSNPSTGYRWSIADVGEPVVMMSATPAYKRGAAAGDRVGAAGEETWRLFAFRTGVRKVTFEYRRSWERDVAPAQAFSFTVEVR